MNYLSCSKAPVSSFVEEGVFAEGLGFLLSRGKGGRVGLKLANRVNLLSKDKKFYTKVQELN